MGFNGGFQHGANAGEKRKESSSSSWGFETGRQRSSLSPTQSNPNTWINLSIPLTYQNQNKNTTAETTAQSVEFWWESVCGLIN